MAPPLLTLIALLCLAAGARLGAVAAPAPTIAPSPTRVPAPAPASPAPRLRFAAGVHATSELQKMLREDQAWLDGLPPASRALAVPADTAAARAWLRRALSPGGSARAATSAAQLSALTGWGAASGRPSATAGEGQARPDSAGVAASTRGMLSLLRDRWLARGRLAVVCAVDSAPQGGAAAAAAGAVAGTAGAAAAPAGAAATTAGAAATTAGAAAPVIAIDPGPDFRVGTVRVEGPDFPGRDALIAQTLPAPGDRFRPAAWTDAIGVLLAGAGDAGFPFARWVAGAVRVDPVRAMVDIEATLFTGQPAIVGRQTSDLPAGRGEAFLRRATGLRMGAPFRESDLERGRDRLLERGLYAEVGEPVVYVAGRGDTVGIHWRIVPVQHPNRFAAVLGFSQPGAGRASRLSGQVDLALPNLAGTGRRLTAGWSDDGAGRSHVGVSWLEPLAFRTPLDIEAALANEVVADSYTRFTADLRARLAVVAAWGIEVGLGWDRSTFPTGDWENTSRQRARAAFYHRRGDLSRSGWSGLFAFETAQRQATVREDTTASGTVVPVPAGVSPTEGSERQNLMELAWNGELFVRPEASFAARGTLNQVMGQGGPIPISEQYYFGGARSVRGYLEDQFHGDQVAYGSLEFRLGRPGRSRIYTFFDMGYYRAATAADSTASAGQRHGVARGFGLGLETHTGSSDVSLAIGFPGTLSFDEAKLHVMLLQSF